MSQQLQLFPDSPVLSDTGFDALLEQTRQLFQHNGSNTELMQQVIHAIQILRKVCEQPEE
jgi:hypothetical protein